MSQEALRLQEELQEIQLNFPLIRAIDWNEASKLQSIHGRNVLSVSKPTRWYTLLLHSFANPFNLILFGLAVVSVATGDVQTMSILIVMLCIGSLMRFVQEFKSNKAAANLRQLVDSKCAVIRVFCVPDNRDPNLDDVMLIETGAIVESELSMQDCVPGDLIRLRAGDLIPGDVQVLKSKDLFISEVSLTGEPLPVAKCIIMCLIHSNITQPRSTLLLQMKRNTLTSRTQWHNRIYASWVHQ